MNPTANQKSLDLPAARAGPDFLIRLRYRAFSSHHQGHLQAAESAYQQVLARTPGDLEVRQALGVLALQAGKYAWALQLLSQVAQTHDSADLQDYLGCALYGLSRFEEALRCHERAIAMQWHHQPARLHRAQTLRELRRLEQATAAAKTARATEPDRAAAAVAMAVPAQFPEADAPPAAVKPASAGSCTLRRLDWRVRLIGAAPTVASCVLAALLGSELAATAYALLARTSPTPDMPPPPRTPVVPFDVSPILTAHLFGVALQNRNLEPASAVRVDLKLTGTLASDDPRRGIAIIGDQGTSRVYSVGESLDGATLHEVYQDHVILEHDGSFESLSLPRERSLLASMAPPGNPGPGDEFPSSVTPGQSRAAFMKWGLQRDDIVVAINGTKLDSGRHGDIWKNVTNDSSVTVLRRGVLEDITLRPSP